MSAEDRDKPVHYRTQLSKNALALMESDPESCKYITTDLDNREAFGAAIKAGLKRGDRTSLRLFAEMARFVGQTVNVANQLFISLGVRGEDELRRKLEIVRGAESVTLESSFEDAKTLIRMCLTMRPEWAEDVIALARSVSSAEVVEDEHPNGSNGTNGGHFHGGSE